MSTLQLWHPEALNAPQSPSDLVEESESLQKFINSGESVGIIPNARLGEMVVANSLSEGHRQLIDNLTDATHIPHFEQLRHHKSWLKEGTSEQGHHTISLLRTSHDSCRHVPHVGRGCGRLIAKSLIIVEGTEGQFLFGETHRDQNGAVRGLKRLNQVDIDEFYLLASSAKRAPAQL